ncbi:MAG TPA: ComEA family DNA-binding protein [Moraxellaceae bacterium]|nr:ComEA family DNA-binding protein [Moraxellaceae bacterium]
MVHKILPVLLLSCVSMSLDAAPRSKGSAHRDDSAQSAPVNVNTAGLGVLVTLKGVGEQKAKAIINFRKAHGPFRSFDDFEAVPGVGPALIDRNRERIEFTDS